MRRCHSRSLAVRAMLESRRRCISHSSELMEPMERMAMVGGGCGGDGRLRERETGGRSCGSSSAGVVIGGVTGGREATGARRGNRTVVMGCGGASRSQRD